MDKFDENIKNLTMTPDMWYELSNRVSSDEYRKIVMEYQEREFNRLPTCNTIFGLCRNFAGGKCTAKKSCKNMVK